MELVSIVNVFGLIMWSKYFMEAQSYITENNVLHKDNKSRILLDTNSLSVAGKASKHTNNQCFLIADIRLLKKELTL